MSRADAGRGDVSGAHFLPAKGPSPSTESINHVNDLLACLPHRFAAGFLLSAGAINGEGGIRIRRCEPHENWLSPIAFNPPPKNPDGAGPGGFGVAVGGDTKKTYRNSSPTQHDITDAAWTHAGRAAHVCIGLNRDDGNIGRVDEVALFAA